MLGLLRAACYVRRKYGWLAAWHAFWCGWYFGRGLRRRKRG